MRKISKVHFKVKNSPINNPDSITPKPSLSITPTKLDFSPKHREDNSGVFSFISHNANILAAIGLIGTMLALMPAFVEKMNDEAWIGTLSPVQTISLFITIEAGIILVFLLFLTMIWKYLKEKVSLEFNIFFGLLTVFFLQLILFLFSAIQKYLVVLIITCLVYFGLIIFFLVKIKNESKEAKTIALITIFFIAILIISQCILPMFSTTPIIEPNANNTHIEVDTNYFNPLIPQTVGIGLAPRIDGKLNLTEYNYIWDANFGYFMSIDPDINRQLFLSNYTTNHGEKIFWTYNPKDIGKIKDNVTINLQIRNSQGNDVINKSVNISWIDQDIANVKN